MSLTLLLMLVAGGAPPASDVPSDTFFELSIRPVLASRCIQCHGAEKATNNLRLDSREAMLQGGDSGPAIVPGNSQKSLVVQAIARDSDDLRMPPDDPLPASSARDFAQWIDAGAQWPLSREGRIRPVRHWAFEPVPSTSIPSPLPQRRAHSPIDVFLAVGHAERGIAPAPAADRGTLLRRATFDLCGLPPTPEELEDFLADPSPTAWQRCLDRLLASPRYGERWGRHWMDVARYADTAGDNADYPIPEAHRYRDYIIESLDADLPYDQFLRQQIAGDLLPTSTEEERVRNIVATGFLALSRRYATAPYELWHLTLEDTIDTLGSSVMGVTLRCARCHDHKFDPISTGDYYRLQGIFASTRFPYAGSEEFESKNLNRQHLVPLASPAEMAGAQAAHEQQRETMLGDIRRLEMASGNDKKALEKAREALRNLEAPGGPTSIAFAYAVSDGEPTDVPIQQQGDPSKPGDMVPRGVPQFLSDPPPPTIPSTASGRLEFAAWLTHADHPLTGRVMVNRVWQHHFGRGLVATPSDFGSRGQPPTHPDLLNWLTREFVDGGWSLKRLHRIVMESDAYGRSCMDDPAARAADPNNATWWRFDRRRLDAESLRDAILFVAGDLDLSRPGPHPFPPFEKWNWTQHRPFKDVYPTRHRSVYLMTQRLVRHPYLARFDFPDTNQSTAARTSSIVPSQALYLLNNPEVFGEAQSFVHRLHASSPDPRERVQRACQAAWCRLPTEDEGDAMVHFVGACADELNRRGAAPESIDERAWASLAKVILMSNEFLFID